VTVDTVNVSFWSQDSGLAQVIANALGPGFVTRTSDESELDRLAECRNWCDVILLDIQAATGETYQTWLRLMDEVRQGAPQPPVIVLVDTENRALTSELIEHGAYDSVMNPPNMIELRIVLRRAYKYFAAEKELQCLRADKQGAGRLYGMEGTSSVMQEVFALAQKIAPCDVNVHITGETGTGKELLARAIHQMSGRAARPWVAFSCANLPETLVEDELFGHDKGAFTGAVMSRQGRLETADQGTLFLDEIGDLGLGLQPKLLRVLQERTFTRLGSNAAVNVDIRVICATNRDLAEMVQQGKFREDLYYRLNVVQIHLPPLRERLDDIPLLAQRFLEESAQKFKKKAKRFSQAALLALEEYGWPGNVRELENAVQRAVVLSEGQAIEIWQLPSALRAGGDVHELSRSYEEEVRQFKRRLILRTLRNCGWKKAESARTLGVARGYLHRLINQLEIQPGEEDRTVEHHRPELPPN
jgi:DNA-binding NtrC family response regulator